MKVLVTGGGGFIGSHIVDRLLADGHDVRVLDNFATGRRENLLEVLDDIELVEGDIQSYERVHNAVGGCEVVLHQGALPSVPRSVQDPLTSNATNVTGTLNVLLAARDAGRPARRLRVVVVDLRRQPGAAEARGAPAAADLARTPWRSSPARATAAASTRSAASRRSPCATSTSSGRGRTRSRSTRR